jgi:DNA-binding SARP family transcriptional activator
MVDPLTRSVADDQQNTGPARKIEIMVAGEPSWVGAGGKRHVLERKSAALLAYLALEGATPRDRLSSLLWPGVDTTCARGNLRQSLLRLRRRMKIAEDLVTDDGAGTLRIAEHVHVDTGAAPGHTVTQDGSGQACDGTLLGGMQFPESPRLDAWLERQRTARAAAHRVRLLERARELFSDGHFGPAVAAAESAVAVDPVAEEPYRCLMEWYYLRGDRAAALVTWDRCLENLRRGYGLRPSAETAKLARSIRDSQADNPQEAKVWRIPPQLLHPPHFTGRDDALRQMRAAWRLGHVICLVGEPGMGKTRVLDELVGPDAIVRCGGARPGDAAAPLSAFARQATALYERFAPELTDAHAHDWARLIPALRHSDRELAPLVTDSQRLRFQESIAEFLRECARKGARAIVFDDVQFADAASIDLLTSLMDDETIFAQIRFALALRPGEAPECVFALLDRLTAEARLSRIVLEPLDTHEIRSLVDSLEIQNLDGASWTARLERLVGGNPAFLLESLKMVLSENPARTAPAELPVPPTVRAAVEWRLQRLRPEALSLVQMASIAGIDFEPALAGRILGTSPLALTPWLAELERAQILRGAVFVHDTVQDVVEKSVPEAIRKYLHRALADAMHALGAPPGRVALHWTGAEQWEQAGACWRAASGLAAQAAQLADELLYLERAAECFERAGWKSETFDALLAAAAIEMQPDYARKLPSTIERLRALQSDERERMQVDIVEADLEINRGRYDACERLTRAAVQTARSFRLAVPEAAAAGRLAHALVYLGRPQEAMAELDRLQGGASALENHQQRADQQEKRALVYSACGKLRLAIEAAEHIVRIGNDSDSLLITYTGLYDVGLMQAWHGNSARAAEAFGAAIAMRSKVDQGGAMSSAIDIQMGAALRDLGHYGQALQTLRNATAAFDPHSLPGWSIKARAELAEVYLSLGRPERALETLGEIPSVLSPPETAIRLVVRARAERQAGHAGDTKARATLREAAALLPERAAPRHHLPVAIEQARDLDQDRCAHLLRTLVDSAMRAEMVGQALYAATLAVAAEVAAGRDASELADRAASWRAEYEPAQIPRAVMLETLAMALEVMNGRLARELRQEADEWTAQVLTRHVPDEFRDSFCAHLRQPLFPAFAPRAF